MNHFNQWYEDNKIFLKDNKIKKGIAELIWNSAKASAMHNLVTMVNDGKLILSFSEKSS